MKELFQILALTLLAVGCAQQQDTRQPAPSISKQVLMEADAVAVVLADIQQRGGNPRQKECSAKKMDGDWWVTAWHIWYPNNTGASRFVPDGFTTYVISTKGKILITSSMIEVVNHPLRRTSGLALWLQSTQPSGRVAATRVIRRGGDDRGFHGHGWAGLLSEWTT